ncbi:MAG: DNA methyltransferase [Cycloclasticus sp. symbiont of Poecilosclerida sp. M]|nr:MAG: DNA methyltransferase [Cycloclasticus sp. symbiont of Poecilosclerida sp. M]
MPRIYSPLRYPGGKTQIAPFVEGLIKQNDLMGGTYVEAFAGGAGVVWHLLQNNIVENVVINDLAPSIFSFWDAALTKTEELCDLIDSTPITIKEWYKQKEIQKNKNIGIELAFSTLFLNRVNRSGILNAGVMGGKAQSGEYKLDCRFNKSALIYKIQRIAERSDQIKLTNQDAKDFLVGRVSKLDSKTLINIDPPYYNKGKELYQNFFEHEDHIALYKSIMKVKLPWMVTYDNTPEIYEIYKEHNPHLFSLNYSAQSKRRGAELLMLSPELIREGAIEKLSA